MSPPRSIPSPPDAFSHWQIGPFTIHAYALCILVGILAGLLVTGRRLTRRGAQPGVVWDFAILIVPLAIIGARIFHVLTHPADYFAAGVPFYKPFAIWEGGNAIFGALLGGAVGVWLACRWTGIRFLSFADAMVPGLLLGQAIGRLGNWFNVELFGLPTDLPWGLQVPESNPAYPVGLPSGTLFHPTFLYEMIWNAAGILLLLALENRLRRPVTVPPRFAPRLPMRWGSALGFYLVWYGLGRSVFESIRIDPTEVFAGLRVNVWVAFAAVAIGIVVLLLASRHPGLEPGVYRPGRQWRPDAAVGSRYTASDFEPSDAAGLAQPVTSGTAIRR